MTWLVHLLLVLRWRRRDLEAEVDARTAEIRGARNQLQGTLAAIPDLLFELDEDGTYLDFHTPRNELLAAPPDRIVGSSVEDWLPEEVVRTIRDAVADAARDGWSVGHDYPLDLEEGRRWFELSVGRRPEGKHGRPSFMLLVRDITARKAAAEELRQSEARFLQTQKLESIGRLAGGVAHDFNNLLTVIQGSLDLAELELPAGHPALDEIEEARSSSLRGAALTQQLLGYASQQVIQPEDLDLNEELREFAGMARRMIREDVQIELRCQEPLPPIRIDGNQLSQILLNLAGNARDAMPRGGVLLLETVLLEADPDPSVLLRISDDGQGMTEEVQARIFEPFFTTKEPGQGSGLGLATTYGIVRQHGGTIRCRSTPGQGTVFEIRLPPAGSPPLQESVVG